MASQIDICNLALSHISCEPIKTLQDGTDSSRLLQLYYPRCRQQAIRDFPWGFATVTDTLALSTYTNPVWDYCYGYPLKCLKVVRIFDGSNKRFTDFDEEYNVVLYKDGKTRLIGTNLKNATITYMYDVEDTTIFDPLFVDALSFNLALAINNAKTGDAQLTSLMFNQYQMSLNKAYQAQAMEQREDVHWPDGYLIARRGIGWRRRRR